MVVGSPISAAIKKEAGRPSWWQNTFTNLGDKNNMWAKNPSVLHLLSSIAMDCHIPVNAITDTTNTENTENTITMYEHCLKMQNSITLPSNCRDSKCVADWSWSSPSFNANLPSNRFKEKPYVAIRFIFHQMQTLLLNCRRQCKKWQYQIQAGTWYFACTPWKPAKTSRTMCRHWNLNHKHKQPVMVDYLTTGLTNSATFALAM